MSDSPQADSSQATITTIEVVIRLGLLMLLAAWCFMIISPPKRAVMRCVRC